MEQLLKKYQEVKLELKLLESEIKEQFLLMNTEKYEVGEFKVVKKKPYIRQSFDSKKFKEDNPLLYLDYIKETEVKESVSISGFFSSHPVVPHTTGMPCSRQNLIFPNADSGLENSITTSGLFRFSKVGDSLRRATISCPRVWAILSIICPIFPYPTNAIFIGLKFIY